MAPVIQIDQPPAIVQTVAAMSMSPVQLPINILTDQARIDAANRLAVCANFTTPHLESDITNPAKAEIIKSSSKTCLATVTDAVRNGTISDVPALVLALRSIPFTDAEGHDKVADAAADITTRIATGPDGKVGPNNRISFDYHLPGLSEVSVNRAPYTIPEVLAVDHINHHLRPKTLTPNRNIPIDPSGAYIMTAADVVMHPARYTYDGKTLAETLATARKDHPAADDQKGAQVCMMNTKITSLQDCQAIAARNTAEMIVDGQAAPYNASQYADPPSF